MRLLRPSRRICCEDVLLVSSRLSWFSKAIRERSTDPRDGEELRDLAVLFVCICMFVSVSMCVLKCVYDTRSSRAVCVYMYVCKR
jgi:hypothetical protein